MKFTLFLVAAGLAAGQQLDLSALDRLAPKAREAANVNLDADKLKLAAGLMGNEGPGGAQGLVNSMQGMFVRTFEFDRTGEYSMADIEPVRTQLKGPNWARIIDVKDKDEAVEVWFYTVNGKMGGMAIIAAEPKELAVVNIVGPLDMQSLGKLTRGLGVDIPNLNLNMTGAPKPKPEARPAPKTEPKPAKDDDIDF